MAEPTLYGEIAIRAATKLRRRTVWTYAADEWDDATRSEDLRSSYARSSLDKKCPRGAFIGLCQAGLIEGVKGDEGDNSSIAKLGLNGGYAVEAVKRLRSDPIFLQQKNGKRLLWGEITNSDPDNPEPVRNGQLDVVFDLWKRGLIKRDDQGAA